MALARRLIGVGIIQLKAFLPDLIRDGAARISEDRKEGGVTWFAGRECSWGEEAHASGGAWASGAHVLRFLAHADDDVGSCV